MAKRLTPADAERVAEDIYQSDYVQDDLFSRAKDRYDRDQVDEMVEFMMAEIEEHFAKEVSEAGEQWEFVAGNLWDSIYNGLT